MKKINGINIDDVPVIMGLSKDKSLLDVYNEKIGLAEKDLNNNEEEYWSIKFKELISKEFSVRTGKQIRRENSKRSNEDYPYMIVDGTRRIVGENSVLFINGRDIINGSHWDQGRLPKEYLYICQHYMLVTNSDICYVATLLNGKKFIYKAIKRDEKLINNVISSEKNFWENYVEKRISPK